MADEAKLGIEKLDDLLGGGLDRYTENLIIGRSGIGKTILAAHWAADGARNDETVVYLSTIMNRKNCEPYLGKFPFMQDVYKKIYGVPSIHNPVSIQITPYSKQIANSSSIPMGQNQTT